VSRFDEKFSVEALITDEAVAAAGSATEGVLERDEVVAALRAALPAVLDHMLTLLPTDDPGVVLSYVHLRAREELAAVAHKALLELERYRSAQYVKDRLHRLVAIAHGKGGRASDVRAEVQRFLDDVVERA
jgi:hypothetical protein